MLLEKQIPWNTFVDSSWYFLTYLDPSNSRLPFESDVANGVMPVDLYIGGKEHATLHLYFARFFNYFLCDSGYLKHREPFTNLLVQGMVMGQSYRVKGTGEYLRPDQVDFSNPKSPVEKSTGKALVVEWEKMSKSKYNGVDPQEIIDEYGVSSTRMTIVYNVAPKSSRRWSNTEIHGVLHWQGRLWKLVTMVINNINQTDSGSHDINEWKRNISEVRNLQLAVINWNFEQTFMISVAITAMQQITEFLRTVPTEVAVNSDIFLQTLADIMIMISPISPAFSSELWEGFRSKVTHSRACDMNKGVQDQSWPKLDVDSVMLLIVKCNSHCRQRAPVGIVLSSSGTSQLGMFDIQATTKNCNPPTTAMQETTIASTTGGEDLLHSTTLSTCTRTCSCLSSQTL